MGLILFILAMVLGVVLLPLGIVYGLFRCFYKHKLKTGLKRSNEKLIVLAKAIDKYGNVVCAELLNDTLITKESRHHFGKIEQTISMVIGLNLLDGTLSLMGKKLNHILDLFDEDHAIESIGDL